jgi:hypothetical protein
MKCRWLLLLAVMSLFTVSASSQDKTKDKNDDRTPPPPNDGGIKNPINLRFIEDGKDLLVKMWIEGPAARQIILTESQVFDGRASWDEPPIGVEKPRRPPHVELRYLVLVNRDLPGFIEPGLMMVPTPQFVREKERNEVVWRLRNFRDWDFKREDAAFYVHATRYDATSDQLKQAIPRIKQTIDAHETRLKNAGPPP